MQGGATQLIFLAVIVAAFWFLLIRPQQQQQKRQAEMLSRLEPGTEIMTIGGIYATIVAVEDDRVRVSVLDGSEFELAKRAVASVVPARDADDDEQDEEETAEAAAALAEGTDSDGSPAADAPEGVVSGEDVPEA